MKQISDDEYECLDYIEARKQIYVPVYCSAARKTKAFASLKSRLEHGENLLILEIDGPHYESLNYYKAKYGVGDDFIAPNNTTDAILVNLKLLLNDSKHPFGHGYCLAAELLGLTEYMLS